MAKVAEPITLNLKVLPRVKITLWQAIKLRLSGMFRKVALIEEIGDLLKITYK